MCTPIAIDTDSLINANNHNAIQSVKVYMNNGSHKYINVPKEAVDTYLKERTNTIKGMLLSGASATLLPLGGTICAIWLAEAKKIKSAIGVATVAGLGLIASMMTFAKNFIANSKASDNLIKAEIITK